MENRSVARLFSHESQAAGGQVKQRNKVRKYPTSGGVGCRAAGGSRYSHAADFISVHQWFQFLLWQQKARIGTTDAH
jgi:hypothetical protein